MFIFLTDELGYCPATAQLRIQAIKALQVVPEVMAFTIAEQKELFDVAAKPKVEGKPRVKIRLTEKANPSEITIPTEHVNLQDEKTTSVVKSIKRSRHIPRSYGGTHSLDNLQLRCSVHNRYRWETRHK